MGANRALPRPEAYPPVFLEILKSGAGVIPAGTVPWTPGSTAKRFRILLSWLRQRPEHPLHLYAKPSWYLETDQRGTVLRRQAVAPPSPGAAIVAHALQSSGHGQ